MAPQFQSAVIVQGFAPNFGLSTPLALFDEFTLDYVGVLVSGEVHALKRNYRFYRFSSSDSAYDMGVLVLVSVFFVIAF